MALKRKISCKKKKLLTKEESNVVNTNCEIKQFFSVFTYKYFDSHCSEEQIANEVRTGYTGNHVQHWLNVSGDKSPPKNAREEMIKVLQEQKIILLESVKYKKLTPETVKAILKKIPTIKKYNGQKYAEYIINLYHKRVHKFSKYFDIDLKNI